MAGWSKLQDLFLKQLHILRGDRKFACAMCWVGCSYALNPDTMRRREYCVQFFWFRIWGLPICFASMKCLGSSDLPVVLTEHHYMAGQVKRQLKPTLMPWLFSHLHLFTYIFLLCKWSGFNLLYYRQQNFGVEVMISNKSLCNKCLSQQLSS